MPQNWTARRSLPRYVGYYPRLLNHVAELLQIGQVFPAVNPPLPLALNGRCKAAFEDLVEVPIGRLQQLTKKAIEVIVGKLSRQLTNQVDVACGVNGVTDAEQTTIALQQPLVDGLVVFFDSATNEGFVMF